MINTIRLANNLPAIQSDHLKLGGSNPQGSTIAFTNYYMMLDGKPCIPVMGEFHFTRFNHLYWDEALAKIKAGGIDILATYVFWIHIEEDEGIFDWSGNNNLRQFIKLCDKHGLKTLVRIGPFAHGECRNGGIPDWLYGRPFPLRSNDARYLAYVERWYQAIGEQLQGLLFKDGGSVIGVQLDNEYMHCGAPWEVTFQKGTEWVPAGSDGAEYIVNLKRLAIQAGLDVPIYSCTGWVRSPIIEDEILPMQGGYAFTPWSPDPNYQQEPTREFIFRNRHLDPVLNGKPTYQAEKYPYACCEIGGGIQITYYHRPIVPPESVEALALMNLAGGANIIGYYMYHGGTNPIGKHSYMNEFTVPRLSYDFQAPLREFSQVADSYRHLRLLHLFLHDFGDLLAPMAVTLPENQASITPEDTETLRYMLRSDGESGFIFLNNYQDHVEMQDIKDIQFQLETKDQSVRFPHTEGLILQKNVSAILPFGLRLDGIHLQYATTQLLTKLVLEDETIYVFFAPHGMRSEYAIDTASYQSLEVAQGEFIEQGAYTYIRVDPATDCIISLQNEAGAIIRILTLSREQAKICTKQVLWGQERLVLSDSVLLVSEEDCILYNQDYAQVHLALYPAVAGEISIDNRRFKVQQDGLFTAYTSTFPPLPIDLQIETMGSNKPTIHLPANLLHYFDDVILQIDYVGDIGNAFVDGKLIHDNFYNGTIWEISLKHLAPTAREIFILITPIRHKAGGESYVPTGMAFRPNNDENETAKIRHIRVVGQHKLTIKHSSN